LATVVTVGRFLLFAVALSTMERLFALHPRRFRRDRWRTDVAHLLFNNIIISVGLVVALVGLIVAVRPAVNPELQAWITTQPAWLEFVEAVAIADVAQYWAHRMTHQVAFLWRFHKVHHSIEEMDWLAAARLHPLDAIFARSVTILPLYLLGFTKATFGAYLGFTALQAIFIHANVRFRFGPLRWVTATPEFHHWHHAYSPADKNFAGNLPILDVVFGTCHLPGHLPEAYGIAESAPAGYVAQLKWPFVRQAAIWSATLPSSASASTS
jgi:sterol desaturase/sphingolipid hydroxylase (fatty acid hydroxylase superfamily)